MSATEEDTELRDLLIQTLENNGVLNKIKAELRASVFLALDEQEKVENKTPLVNESLKRFLSTRDGCLVANIFAEFLQFFNLDFTLAVFQPEASLGKMEDRSQLAKDLGIIELQGSKTGPLIFELIKKCHQKDKIINSAEIPELMQTMMGDKLLSLPKELSPKQIAEAQKKFGLYKDKNGEISKDELRSLFLDLFPHFHRNMLERFVNDEFKAAEKDFNNGNVTLYWSFVSALPAARVTCLHPIACVLSSLYAPRTSRGVYVLSGIDFHEFIGMYKRLFIHCRSVVAHDVSDIIHSPRRTFDGRTSAQGILSKGQTDSISEKSTSSYKELKKPETLTLMKDVKPDSKFGNLPFEPIKGHNLEHEEDSVEGDSFFDDPIPKPEKTYGCQSTSDESSSGECASEIGSTAQNLRNEQSNFESHCASPPLNIETSSHSAAPMAKDSDLERRLSSLKDLKTVSSKMASLELGGGGNEDDYADDFNSTSQRSDKSDVSIGEEIEEDDLSVDDLLSSDKLPTFEYNLQGLCAAEIPIEDLTLDCTVSQISNVADYLEDVS